MSETTTPPQPGGQPQTPPLVVNIQYVKDLSFEVPGAPQIFSQLRAQPQVNINLDVQARRVQEGQSVFEVSIVIRAEAHEAAAQGNGQAAAVPPTVFVAELTYAGVFTLTGLPDNAVEPVLLVECPRILFPFARNILSDVTRAGPAAADRLRRAVAGAPRAGPGGPVRDERGRLSSRSGSVKPAPTTGPSDGQRTLRVRRVRLRSELPGGASARLRAHKPRGSGRPFRSPVTACAGARR